MFVGRLLCLSARDKLVTDGKYSASPMLKAVTGVAKEALKKKKESWNRKKLDMGMVNSEWSSVLQFSSKWLVQYKHRNLVDKAKVHKEKPKDNKTY